MSGQSVAEGLDRARRGVGVGGRGGGRPTVHRRRMSRGALTLILFACPSLILLLLINLYPLLYAGLQSVRNGNLISPGTFVGLENYVRVLTDSTFWQSAWFT